MDKVCELVAKLWDSLFVIHANGDYFNAEAVSSLIAAIGLLVVIRQNNADLRKAVREQKRIAVIALSSEIYNHYTRYFELIEEIKQIYEEGNYFLEAGIMTERAAECLISYRQLKVKIYELRRHIEATKTPQRWNWMKVLSSSEEQRVTDTLYNATDQLYDHASQYVSKLDKLQKSIYPPSLGEKFEKARDNDDNVLEYFNIAIDDYIRIQWQLLKKGK